MVDMALFHPASCFILSFRLRLAPQAGGHGDAHLVLVDLGLLLLPVLLILGNNATHIALLHHLCTTKSHDMQASMALS
jgi:hypothetical protein